MKKIKMLIIPLLLIILSSSVAYSEDFFKKRFFKPSSAIFLGTTNGVDFQYFFFDMSIGYHYKEILRFNLNFDLILIGIMGKFSTYIPLGDRMFLNFKLGIIYDYDCNNKSDNTGFKIPVTLTFLLGDKHEGSRSELFLEVAPVMDIPYSKIECIAGFRFFF